MCLVTLPKASIECYGHDLTNSFSDHPKHQGLDRIDPQTYSSETLSRPVVRDIVSNWSSKLEEPYIGITFDGKRKENLFELADEGAPVEQMVS